VAKVKEKAEFNSNFIDVAQKLAASGATDTDIAFLLGTSKRGLRNWKKENPEFKKALNRGRELSLAYLIAQGIRAAAGYDYTETTTKEKKVLSDGVLVDLPVETVTRHRHQPTDAKLLMFLVAALDRQLGGSNWLSQHKIEIDDKKNINIHLTGEVISNQIDELAGRLSKLIPSQEVPQLTEATFEPKV